MNYKDFITRNSETMLGKPVKKGTRITVELVIRKLAEGYTTKDILTAYPHLSEDQIRATVDYAADMIANEETLESI